ncbi:MULTISPECIES: ATPase RavA stimulator ViaA [Photobacterium]|uniref:Protein viaA n=1 Tax=Photobacterium ganghwense TaxID=320778 RepID=A0A0J1H821_9GAMM|nr:MULTISPECIES: ATPase RavA stimulator ViaA [Photobacterium]KLV07874.1 protein viaA [Photobacterium ganghwense]MBV1841164.1 ATPase RavA stimulator ViaA [Photobacterium ganghwense]PSU06972.1 ATPase RavA stimulator ViaA [Photobacterium ganghwense]QSV15726.1 ATPase RavA stimulator ViaA [Photobacterium ganghwense]
MPVTEGLNLAMMLTESGIIDNAVNELMMRPQLIMAAESNPGIKAAMKSQIMKWRGQVHQRITKVSVEERFHQEIELYQTASKWDAEYFTEHVKDVVKKLEGHSAFYFKAKTLLEREYQKHNPMFQSYFCNQWYQHLTQALTEAQLAELEQHKEQLLADLYQRIETMRHMEEVTGEGDEKKAGRLWDMAKAKLTKTDVSTLKAMAAFLKKNSGLREIAEKLGRMASEVDDPNKERVRSEDLKMVEERSDNVTDDIVGIHESDDLSKLLPNEAMFLAYPELEVVFYKHLVDKRLMNYRVQGAQRKLRRVKAYKRQTKQVEQEKGPFIVCIDASGSMNGFPEQCAKALAYGLMQIALAEDRDCYVIMFSTQQITYELTRQDGLSEVLNFLSYSFHGGTDLGPVLDQSIELMLSEKYQNADLIVLSDFIAPSQPEAMMKRIQKLKDNRNRFHAVNFSKYGNPELMTIFDHCWSYHPSKLGRLLKWR